MKADLKRVVAIIQARMGATRLPGKVLEDIAGQPMLVRVVERARLAKSLASVVVATTIDPGDDIVAELCKNRGYPFVRGDAQDVLARYLQVAHAYQADIVVRLTADCPLIDPGEIDHVVSDFLESEPPVDYASNRIVRSYPIGLDTEVMKIDALEQAGHEANQRYQREHVTPYLYEEPGRFRTLSIESGGDYGAMRWTVDTPEDLAFARQIYQRLEGRSDFGWRDVLAILEREPELAEINANIRHKGFREVG